MGRRIFNLSGPPPEPDKNLQFPEWEYPPLLGRSEEYWLRINHGSRRMLDTTVVFAGCVRDIAEVLPLNIRRLEKIAGCFKDYRVVIYESDSIDGTKDILQQWTITNPRIIVLSENLGNPRMSDETNARMELMAVYRNKYLDYIQDNLSIFDNVIVLDLDFGSGWSIDGIKNSYGYWGWDCISSNGLDVNPLVGGYYDILPFYLNSFGEDDLLCERRPGYKNLVLKRDKVRPRFLRGQPLVRCHSAFGGLAIYKMEAFLAGRYYSHMCDHATLNEQLWSKNFDMHFINPSMIGLR